MQTFKDTATDQFWQFDDDVAATLEGGKYVFTAANGNRLDVPETLVPGVLPEPVDPQPQLVTRFAPRDYLKRFTRTEYGAARTHANIDVQWALDNLIGAQYVDIEDPETIAGLDLMVAESIITPEKRADLLTPQPAA